MPNFEKREFEAVFLEILNFGGILPCQYSLVVFDLQLDKVFLHQGGFSVVFGHKILHSQGL